MYKRISTIILLLFFYQCFDSTANSALIKDSTIRFRHSFSINIARIVFQDYIGFYQYRASKRIGISSEFGYATKKTRLASANMIGSFHWNYEGPELSLCPKYFFEPKFEYVPFEIYLGLYLSYQHRIIDQDWIDMWDNAGPHPLLIESKWKKYGINLMFGVSSKPEYRFYYDFFLGYGFRYHDLVKSYLEQDKSFPYFQQPLPITEKSKYWSYEYVKLGFRLGFSF